MGTVFVRSHLIGALIALGLGQIQVSASSADNSVASLDSCAVATFLKLPEGSLQERIDRAAKLAAQAQDASDGPLRMKLFTQATQADPSDTRLWLGLAETEMAMGYPEQSEASLAAARVTIEFSDGDARRDAARDLSLAISWWAFEMGNFEGGLAWARKALKYGASLDGHLLVGLNRASTLPGWAEARAEAKEFRPLNGGGNRKADVSWCFVMFAHFQPGHPFWEGDLEHWINRTTQVYDHDEIRWRDYGLYCEANGSESLARIYYEKGFSSLPIRDGNWLTRASRVTDASPQASMPFWMNMDGGYVTGSLLAHAMYAHEEMTAATVPADRARWAEQVVLAASRTVRRMPGRPWPLLWQCEALLVLDRLEEASTAIPVARGELKRHGYVAPELDLVEGRVFLQQGEFAQAAPLLSSAAASFPDDASCWADLGMAELRNGHDSSARKAFDRALELDASLSMVLYHRANLQLRAGNRQQALEDLERASDIDPENSEISRTLENLRSSMEAEERGVDESS
ncbi:hypothetical protein DRQ53_09760 [bacterium]|nr:MAG: hypothetical protein DRQ32_02055 [bacterium]RKZ15164.1 MAG: hypothetical protein DRQ53_09760 [bacterium]